jgi:hypothetical protein
VRNPERLRDFLRVLKRLEGKPFDKKTQIEYQILLIKEKIYKPQRIPFEFREYYEEPDKEIPFEVAQALFYAQNYEDPPMRGRQSVNPLNKLGFSIAREGLGAIKITELGNRFLTGDYDVSYIFFKSLLKLQFPNPWNVDFPSKEGFNIVPFIGVLHLLYRLNRKSDKSGLDRTEFSLFIPTLINFREIDKQVEYIVKYRRDKDKKGFIRKFAEEFYGCEVPDKKINNLYDYGDNIMRYFRLTRYFKFSSDSLGRYWNIDLEPTRKVEIEQLLEMYSGEAREFRSWEEYIEYVSDISKPALPWEKKENLARIFSSLKEDILKLISEEGLQVGEKEEKLLQIDTSSLTFEQLESNILHLRELLRTLREEIKRRDLLADYGKIEELIKLLRNSKELRKYEPEQFEKFIVEVLRLLNDEILIKPNYPVDDEGEPVNHSPGNKPDIECYYKSFKAICEVTLNTSRLQWIEEGQPVMRHLRAFENCHRGEEVLCLFIAPRIHTDTYSQFWISVKYEYDGAPQKIVPLTTEQLAILLETLLFLLKSGRKLSHLELYKLYSDIINGTRKLTSFSEWASYIDSVLNNWQERMATYEN